MTGIFPIFDPLNAPLAGRTLVEASAGTGKTWTIAALCVRLLVEQGLEVEQILVVTYTEAATAELRERVRGRLSEALAVFSGGSGDEFLTALAARCSDRETACARLRRALLNFEQAAIHTIHGFCQRVLRDRAFEARALFDTELATDLSALEEELADDFWRRRSTTFTPAFADFLLAAKYGPDALLKLQRHSRRPERILPEVSTGELAAQETACRAQLQELAELWRSEQEAIIAGVRQALPGLHGNVYSEERLVVWERELGNYCSGTDLWGADKALERLGTFKVKKGGVAPTHRFHSLCEAFFAARSNMAATCAQELLALQRDYLLWREEESVRRKVRHNVRTFDDLLLDVRAALTSEETGGLLAALRDTFRAVLIDEFQDTDPVQYAIFGALCPDRRSTLFLIGDPKQAIYAFRGADIFTYLRATQQVERRCTLGVNRRSAPGLVQGVNTLFARSNPFLINEIPYPAVAADLERNGRLALCESGDAAPLRLWSLLSDEPLNKGTAITSIIDAVVAEIVRLLATKARLRNSKGEERFLSAGDIAVLVRTNREAAQVIEALRRSGVAGVRQGSESLFASREALDLLRLMQALAAPHDLELVRGALATPYFGFDATALAQTVDDPLVLEPWLDRLLGYHQLWVDRGIAVFSSILMLREGMAIRLLGLPDGERRLTNLRHCLEVLHRAESEGGLRMEGLLKWFSRHIASPPAGEEYQLRLETDATAVQVVTIHRSKGLEYPVCFVPFCWNPSRIPSRFKNEPFHFHLPQGDGSRGSLCLDLGSDSAERDRYQSLAEREALAENLRLCYVALTRAQARCYLVWGTFKDAESSALAWLFHAPEEVSPGDELRSCEATVRELSVAAFEARLNQLVTSEVISVEPLPAGGGVLPASADHAEELIAPPVPQPVRSLWRLTSYSALVANAHHPAEGEGWLRAERGEHAPPLVTAEGSETIHDFPAGAEAGSCLHDILEVVDFTAPTSMERCQLIAATLERYRIDNLWTPVVGSLLDRLFFAPLDPSVPDLRLGRIARNERCSEMGFFLPVSQLDAPALGEVFARHRDRLPDPRLPEALAQLDFGSVAGMMRGFIDLVFVYQGRYYLIDWKSNRLGRTASDYDRSTMAEEMLATGYLLQYHLYCVALHRHLQRTLPGYDYARHFGGVFYLFLRGIDPAAGDYGIYRDCPVHGLIEELDQLLGEGGQSHAG